ncbi:MAG: TonB-dependent receptor [Acidobacteriota bacterium]|nr:TonB-dependent receptor [Acidobacteriota bacterium]
MSLKFLQTSLRSLALLVPVATLLLICGSPAHASIFGTVQGIVHDTQHRPIAGAVVRIQAEHEDRSATATTGDDGHFAIASLPLGEYRVTVSKAGFADSTASLVLASDTSPILHVELQVSGVTESVDVTTNPADGTTATPEVLVNRAVIESTPGADRTNSLAMITDFVPGAYMTHDMLHVRGGHQVSWQIDGVAIPNTNIGSNVGAQIDPKDIDYLESQRGSYTADIGDRTFGVFNVVPRTGFERNGRAELVLSAGNFLQAGTQINYGNHTQRFAYYASLNGNRSDYGLAPPVGQVRHDMASGYGGFVSLIQNQTPKDQLRFVGQARADSFQIPYDPDPNSFGNQQFDSSGLRDRQHEADVVAEGSWLHTLSSTSALQLSPVYHYNQADYDSSPLDTPVATTSHRTSSYVGGQANLTAGIAGNMLDAGAYGFGQRDSYLFGAIFNDGSGNTNFTVPDSIAGGVAEAYLSDNYKLSSWLTVIGGVRYTLFDGSIRESEVDPRAGLAVRVPRLQWVFRGFYGRFYQPPPLLTASGPVLQYAQANDTGFVPLHGEHDEEHQFGLQIPFRGWLLDADTFRTRIRNFLDHSNLGASSIYYPVTIDGALVRAWELTLRSPLLAHGLQMHLAYSNQIAEQRGNLTGGLICTPVGSVQCDAGFAYHPVDHDQRNTLNVGMDTRLPERVQVGVNVYYGSGFVNGNPDPNTPYPNAYLPQHTTFDVTVSRSFGRQLRLAVTALNAANRRLLLDNSLTFGGFHYNDPRQLYAEVRYRFGR